MDSIQERTRIWHAETGRRIHFNLIDLARDYELLKGWLADHRPDAIVHFAEQRAAPYSMKSDRHKNYTVNNNVNATHNLLNALVELELDTHLVHLGTMGVYGYSTVGAAIPEGYLSVGIETMEGTTASQDILYPSNPGSIYHMTKCLDQLLFQFYAKNDRLRITDLHQGIVWGTHTEQTRLHEQLINRFDYDGDYGTVLNRFLIQAAIGYPLTVHGTGGQTRAFIHIQDSVRCIEIALNNPPARGSRVEIFNQMTETHRVRDLAEMISRMSGAQIAWLPNPRKEAPENDLVVKNEKFLALGLQPITLGEGLLSEIVDVAKKYAYRVDRTRVPAVSAWTRDIAATVERDPEGRRLRSAFYDRPTDFAPLHLDPGFDQEQAFEGIEAFVHAAFDHLPGKYRGGEGGDPDRFQRLNLDGSIQLFQTAARAGVGRIVFLSSRAVYDGVAAGDLLREDLPLWPSSLYGRVKLACEEALAALSGPNLAGCSLRSTGVYGHLRPNKWDGLIATALAGRPVVARAGSEVHGSDVAQAVHLLLQAAHERVAGQSFNLTDIVLDNRLILGRLGLARLLPPSASVETLPMDTAKIRAIGWVPGGMPLFDRTMTQLTADLRAGS
eukprot:g7611.t1